MRAHAKTSRTWVGTRHGTYLFSTEDSQALEKQRSGQSPLCPLRKLLWASAHFNLHFIEMEAYHEHYPAFSFSFTKLVLGPFHIGTYRSAVFFKWFRRMSPSVCVFLFLFLTSALLTGSRVFPSLLVRVRLQGDASWPRMCFKVAFLFR